MLHPHSALTGQDANIYKLCMRVFIPTRYNCVVDSKTGVEFYVDTSNEACLLTTPREATLTWAFEHSEGTGRVLGQHREWEVKVTCAATAQFLFYFLDVAAAGGAIIFNREQSP